MAFNILYKRLFEVNILHAFFLDRGEGDSFFDAGISGDEKLRRLENYNIWNQFAIAPTSFCKRQMENHHMVFKPTSTGFLVGVEVDTIPRPGLKDGFKPRIPLEDNFTFHFRLVARSQQLPNITEERIAPETNAKYFFEIPEEFLEADPKALVLSRPASAYRSRLFYEMGDIVLLNGRRFQALQRTNRSPASAARQWKTLPKDLQTVSGADRQLVSRALKYHFYGSDPGTEVNINLANSRGDQVFKRTITNPGNNLTVNLSRKEWIDGVEKEMIPPGNYLLSIQNPGLDYRHNIRLDDKLFNGGEEGLHREARNVFGMIEIRHRAGLGPYRILEEDGILSIDDQNNATPPVYEIRFPARNTFWRYQFSKGFDITLDPGSDVKKDPAHPKRLVSTNPHKLGFSKVKLKAVLKQGNLKHEVELPTPELYNLKLDDEGRVYSEIYLRSIK